MTNPKISVILSAYNEEKFIRKAIESVSNQTLEDIEIIIINDGSTDTTLDIINSYADKDNRIVVIDQENIGLGASRNKGMKIAQGGYVTFLDGDDWFTEEAFEIAHQAEDDHESGLFQNGAFNEYRFGKLCQCCFPQRLYSPAGCRDNGVNTYDAGKVEPCYLHICESPDHKAREDYSESLGYYESACSEFAKYPGSKREDSDTEKEYQHAPPHNV